MCGCIKTPAKTGKHGCLHIYVQTHRHLYSKVTYIQTSIHRHINMQAETLIDTHIDISTDTYAHKYSDTQKHT